MAIPWEMISHSLSLFLSLLRGFAIGCVHPQERQRETETESEKSPSRGDGHTATPSLPFSSRDLGRARTHAQREFKPPGP